MIDKATIDKIMDAANIVDVVSEFVALRKAGVNYKGLCPFHDEKTPSFMVSPSKGYCHCFSCGKGGNAVGFIMEHEQMTYPEALRWLAKKYNIEIHDRELSAEERREANDRESMFIVNEWAMKYFQDNLNNHVEGRAIGMQYFRQRGFRDDTINKFMLGYALQEKDALAKAARAKGFNEQYLIDTGLCYRKDNGQLQDRYYGRVIFPVHNVTGRIVAFGGRILSNDKKLAKYVNSPESLIYHKSNELYGIYLAKQAISKNDRCYLVEGYIDVTSMHQHGVENVVASSGTSLTTGQIRLIRRFTPNITVLYDGDPAGIHASIRGIDMLLSEGMNVKVLLLPDGDDPDSFARKHPAQEFRDYIEEHQTDFIAFKTNLLLKGVTDPIKRSEAINSIVHSVAVIQDPIKRATYIADCAHRLGMNENTLIGTMNNFIREGQEQLRKEQQREERRQDTTATTVSSPQAQEVQQATKIEYMLVQLVVRYGETIIYKDVETEDGGKINLSVAQYISYDLGADNLTFHDERYNRILQEAVEHNDNSGFKAESYFTHHPDVSINQLATEMAIDRFQLSKSLQVKHDEETLRNQVEHLVLDFRKEYVQQRLSILKQQIALSANDMERMRQLMEEYKEIQSMRNTIARELGNEVMITR
ncbi:MAG: DNA primase [Bacteroidales bacterium]|nr:DNA primase [Bacteroidales bacterium]MDD5788738.1 DNA primase [Bacteroidales bacterium]MDY4731138.1 DNA primase [Prevotella sp.]MDY6028495.1 DNA primase [Prevotella sp.]